MTINIVLIFAFSLLGHCWGLNCDLEVCNDLSKVKICGNIKECISKVWVKSNQEVVSDSLCDTCLKMVEEARNQLESNQTMDEIKQVLDGSCDLLRVKPLVKTCRHFADEFVPELVDMLASQMDPATVCAVAKLCQTVAKRANQEISKECSNCQNFTLAALEFLEQISKKDFQSGALDMCRSLGTFSDACFLYLSKFEESLYKQVQYALKKNPCNALNICPDGTNMMLFKQSSPKTLKHSRQNLCSLCPKALTSIRKAVIKESVDIFKDEISNICKVLSSFENECVNFLQDNYIEARIFLAEQLNPEYACSNSFGFCEQVSKDVPVWPLLPASDNTTQQLFLQSQEAGHKRHIYYGDPIANVGNNPLPNAVDDPIIKTLLLGKVGEGKSTDDSCKICLIMVHMIEEEVQNPKNRDAIRKTFYEFCKFLPGNFKESCKEIVDSNIENLVDFITNQVKPMSVCHEIHMCQKQLEQISESEMSILTNSVVPSKVDKDVKGMSPIDSQNPTGCKICLMAMKKLLEDLGDQKTEDAIKAELKKLCGYFPSDVQEICRDLISQYAEEIVDMVIADFTAPEICGYIKMCKPQVMGQDITSVINFSEISLSGACRYCSLLENSMKNNEENASENMLSFLGKLCSVDNEKYHECNKKLLTEVLSLGAKAFHKMDNVCKHFKICGFSKRESEKEILQRMHLSVQECAMCQTLSQIIAKREYMHVDDYDFSESAKVVCVDVPQSAREQCSSLLVSYGPSIVNLLVKKKADIGRVCSDLSLCDEGMLYKVRTPVSQPEPSSSVSTGNPCLQGPSFWCLNEVNARQCGTYVHCMEAVWKNGVPPN